MGLRVGTPPTCLLAVLNVTFHTIEGPIHQIYIISLRDKNMREQVGKILSKCRYALDGET